MEQQHQQFKIIIADESHQDFARIICDEMESSAKARGTGIAKRSPDYIQQKMREGKAVIAFTEGGVWAGFCYIETWSHGEYVANSGLIVSPPFRKSGLAKQIKRKIFELSRKKYPEAKIFGLTTGLAVMKINSELGYEPVTYSELTQDDAFWDAGIAAGGSDDGAPGLRDYHASYYAAFLRDPMATGSRRSAITRFRDELNGRWFTAPRKRDEGEVVPPPQPKLITIWLKTL